MSTGLFKDIDKFKTNSELFLNFAFFRFLELLGIPFLEKISRANYFEDYNSFFKNLKVKCDFEEKVVNGEKVGYLNLLFEDKSKDIKGFNTHIYSVLDIHGKTIYLNGNEDKYEENSERPRVRLSSKTLRDIRYNGYNGRTYSNLELHYNNDKIYDPLLLSLIDLYLINKIDDSNDYQEKINLFVKKVSSDPKVNEFDSDIFEYKDGNNRIKYENLQKGEIYFIQGPPGTGKTYTINRIIEENELNRKFNKIIVSSYVHVAINNIIEHIMQGKDIPEDKYHKFYDVYQYMTILYSNRALSKVEESPVSELIELDRIIDGVKFDKAEQIYSLRKNNSDKLVNDFDKLLSSLDDGDFENYIETANSNLENVRGEKFKRIFNKLNNSGEKFIDYDKAISLMNELSNKYNNEFVKGSNIDWGISNYSLAIKNYSNVIFCSLDTLHKELERQQNSDNILVIIDEASKSNIMNYLLLLNNIENITLLILGDPRQLNMSLVFDSNLDKYARIMTAFYNSSLNDLFRDDKVRDKKRVMNCMKQILFEIEKNKSNRVLEDSDSELGYEHYSERNIAMWKEILSETFYETLFDVASPKRRKLLNIHRRSRREIFNLSKMLYDDSYVLGGEPHNDNLLIPGYDIVTRIVADDFDDGCKKIRKVISKWEKQKNKISNDNMNFGIITFYNDYRKKFENNFVDILDNDISIYTIDSSQGKQFTTVVLYFDINPNESKSLITKFSMDYHRLNVAVSRAREQLIIVETKRFLSEFKNRKFNLDDDSKRCMQIMKEIHNASERGDSDE